MSRLEELIKKLCPDGVEYKTLGSVCEFKNGFAFKSNLFQTEGEPILRITNISDGYINDKDLVCFNVSDYKEDLTSYVVNNDDIVVAMSGATTGKIGINKTGKKLYLNQRVGKYIPNEDVLSKQFLYHWLLSQSKEILMASTGTGAQPNLSSEKMKQFKIPVPPLEVQSEIVRILDNFTELTAELTEKLTAELTARKKQYEYYRDELLTFGDDVPMIKLGDIATIKRGGNFQKKDFVQEGKPCIHYGQMYTHYGIYSDKTLTMVSDDTFESSKQAGKNDIIMAVTSENVDDVCKCTAWLGDNNIAVSGHTAIISHNQNAKYLSYYFHTTGFYKQKKKLAHGTKVIEVTPDKLKDIVLPVPPLEEQQRIVDILDRFDKLCNDISEGLPAEIEARQKQYEYYRDKLLTFKEKVVE